ncbi:MAG: hypothetical protein ABJH98_16440 [Reichenbachiella sp.]|uniref:hypothetical protein n=1 Tax=Reichenbachiella sp. TaxID=2184521 RepID=UPI003297E918
MSVKENAVVTVSFKNGEIVLCDNEGSHFDPKKPESFTTKVRANGKIGWVPGEGISEIKYIRVDSGYDMFKRMPREKDGLWFAKIDRRKSNDAKYTIVYKVDGEDKLLSLDPVLKIEPPTGG